MLKGTKSPSKYAKVNMLQPAHEISTTYCPTFILSADEPLDWTLEQLVWLDFLNLRKMQGNES